jgi:hypothetical protein
MCRILVALYAQFGLKKFPADWWLLLACVAVYSAITALLSIHSWFFESDAFFIARAKTVGMAFGPAKGLPAGPAAHMHCTLLSSCNTTGILHMPCSAVPCMLVLPCRRLSPYCIRTAASSSAGNTALQAPLAEKPGPGLRISSHGMRYKPAYGLRIAPNSEADTRPAVELERSVTDYFHADGYFAAARLQADVQQLLERFERGKAS